jgi:hypothetical protein
MAQRRIDRLPIREFRRPKRGRQNIVQNTAQAAMIARLRAQGKPKIGYIAALKAYNLHKGYVKGKSNWCVPTKGTKGSSDIRAIMMQGGIPESMLQTRDRRTAADWKELDDHYKGQAQFGAYATGSRGGKTHNDDMIERLQKRYADVADNDTDAFGTLDGFEQKGEWSQSQRQYSKAVDPARLRSLERGKAKFRKFARPDSQFR